MFQICEKQKYSMSEKEKEQKKKKWEVSQDIRENPRTSFIFTLLIMGPRLVSN